MNTIRITPLDGWTCRKIGRIGDPRLNRRDLARYQLDALNHTLAHVRRNSPHYRRRFSGFSPDPLKSLSDLAVLPFTSAEDVCRDPFSFLCVSQDRISRVVTLETSGTTGGPKRLFFTEEDLELTVDFFHHGMSILVDPGQRVLILLPGNLPGSVGALLDKGLARLSVQGIVHGPVQDPQAAIHAAVEAQVDCLVGIPVQVLAMACHEQGGALAGQIKSVLLSTDYVPDAIAARLHRAWGCRVFKHYGMTEMGLGGAVECAARSGCHFREADLLVEIIDPGTLQPMPDGKVGEIVVSTLTREGMPLIRYRTGDMSAFMVDPCRCGTVLKTLGTVRGRLDGSIKVGHRKRFYISDLDEAIFGAGDVLDYHVGIDAADSTDRLTLWIAVVNPVRFAETEYRIRSAVLALPAIGTALADGRLTMAIRTANRRMAVSTGTGKRRIRDLRERQVYP